MDLIIIIIGFLLILTGIIGSFLPIMPGPITGWFGLLVLYQTSFLNLDYSFLLVTLFIAVSIFILDYFIPAIGAKKFGGTKTGVIGSTLGTVIGIILFGPMGIIFGAFLGAFIGELSTNKSNTRIALKAAIGTLVGYIGGILLKLSLGIVFTIKFVKIILNNWNEIF
ncbi:MAG: DUF456 domain-containing protein [Flavobacteriaceae bacterium TMED121]|nr:MAG: DUF456 domain-containing protein [Flavobacteriaceae bacterium TMED121]|tara:strand:+ start:4613 stop:5113 length:501 start_codon:yes stop_codon:yes gene_type:complete